MSRNISDELAKELEKSIKRCPSIFKTGGDVLEHIFCVNGNGYEWVDGEPYQEIYKEENIYDSPENYLNWLKSFLGKDIDEESHLKTYIEEVMVIRNANSLAHDKRKRYRSIYPLCEYSLINTVPEDVKPVWKEAVEIVKEMIEWYPNSYEMEKWMKGDSLVKWTTP